MTDDRLLATAIMAVSLIAAVLVPRALRSPRTRLASALRKVLRAPVIMAAGTALAFALGSGTAFALQGAVLGATLTWAAAWFVLLYDFSRRIPNELDRARRRRATFQVASGLLALGAFRFFVAPPRVLFETPAASIAIVFGTLILLVVWARDTSALHRLLGWARRAKLVEEPGPERADQTIFLGLGDEQWVVDERPASAYRDGRAAELLIVGRLIEVIRRFAWTVTGRTVAVFAALLALHLALRPNPWASPAVAPSPPPPPPEPVVTEPPKIDTTHRTWLSWYPQSGPILEDLDDDGVEDIVGLRWDAGHEAAALSVVANSGKTFQPLWRIPAVPAQWASRAVHLDRSGGTLFFADGEGTTRVIDLRSGAVRATVQAPRVEHVCAAAEGPGRVFLTSDMFGEKKDGTLIDAEGHVEAGKRPAWCTWSWEVARCPRKDGEPCTPAVQPAFLNKVVRWANPLVEGDIGVATAGLMYPKKDDPPGIDVLFGFDPKTTVKRWESRIPFTADELHPNPNLSHTLRGGRFFAYYQLRSGRWLLGARDGRSGEALWFASPPRAEHGTHFSTMKATRSRLYVALDTRLEVFDAATGNSIGVVW